MYKACKKTWVCEVPSSLRYVSVVCMLSGAVGWEATALQQIEQNNCIVNIISETLIIWNAFCYAVVSDKAQTPLIRFVVDLLYNKLYNKSTTNWIGGV